MSLHGASMLYPEIFCTAEQPLAVEKCHIWQIAAQNDAQSNSENDKGIIRVVTYASECI